MTEISIGLIRNEKGEYLISLRDENIHQGGKWEFPGGKLDELETAQEALYRELQEEVSITVINAALFERFTFDYEDKRLILNFYLVTNFSGQARSKIGQAIKWVSLDKLLNYDFPKANKKVTERLMIIFK